MNRVLPCVVIESGTKGNAMPDKQFDRDSMARWYAKRHLKTDPGILTVYYLPAGAPAQEIRLVEINEMIADRNEAPLEPIDFGVDIGGVNGHTLMVLDVTPNQWEKIRRDELELPDGWSLNNAIAFPRK